MKYILSLFLLFALSLTAQSDRTDERFEIAGHKAFLIQPNQDLPEEGKPWVWYAPTFDKRLPGGAEEWMFKQWLAEGISIAGVDVGESYGSPTGREVFQQLYLELTGNRGYSKKPVLLARSRGGLMLYSWATEYPQNVGGIAGIYPVTDFSSYPGLKRASGAYKMTPEELEKEAKELNPVERVGSLIQAKVPVFHIHGDSDKVVPHTPNSVRIKKQYDAAGAPMELEVVPGQGHNMWKGWFESHTLLDFVITHAKVQNHKGFKVYAASNKEEALWIVNAVPQDCGKLNLSLHEKIELGFPGKIITQHPDKPLLYVSPVSTSPAGATMGAVISLKADGSYASKSPMALNDGVCYLSLDRQQRHLLGVSYQTGRFHVYPLDKAGVPGKAVSSIDGGRKAAHCILVSPDNKNLYIPYVKDQLALFQYKYDGNSGKVTPLTPKDAKPPIGTGPRHIAYHPTLPKVYFSNEQGVGLSVYDRLPNGQLKFNKTIEVVPEGRSKTGLSASDLVISPDAKYLFGGLRGAKQNFDHISRYKILPNGDAHFIGLTKADEIPWGLEISPCGNYLLVTASKAGTLTAYRIEGDGNLTEAGKTEWHTGINDLIAR